MRALTGSVIMLAGAVAFGASVIGQALFHLAKMNPDPANIGQYLGFALILIGLVLVVRGILQERKSSGPGEPGGTGGRVPAREPISAGVASTLIPAVGGTPN